MKQLILLCMFLMSIAIFSVGCEGQELKAPEKEENKKPVVIESYFESKKPVLFEHYFMYNMYSNSQGLIHDKLIDLVAKSHNVSSNDFYELYSKEYAEWYYERIKQIKD